ncbi:hypothetical protein ACFVTC_18470 [Streptomyces sp. NPDC057950]|uniref:hypothetical protein n=1 Tax=Streptomyces sp. NPDC057950 TaxID=3346288 RepID=UPI0036E403B0
MAGAIDGTHLVEVVGEGVTRRGPRTATSVPLVSLTKWKWIRRRMGELRKRVQAMLVLAKTA